MLPKDPMILLSWLNTKLRDDYTSLQELCNDLNEDENSSRQQLNAVGFHYDPEQNRFC